MPMVRVEMFPGRSKEQKQQFAKHVTDGFVAICGGTPQSVHIVFSDIEKEDWAVGGTLCSELAPKPAAADGAKQD